MIWSTSIVFNRLRQRWAVLLLLTATIGPLTVRPIQAQTVNQAAQPTSSPQITTPRVRVVANDTYRAGWLHRIFFGTKYREVWATPFEVDVLDLDSYAGGLTLIRGGGMGQSKTLHLQGADGRRYVFRPVNKEILLPAQFDGTIIKSVIQDLKVSSFHPAAALAAAPLSEALDILHVTPHMYVMPAVPPLDSLSNLYSDMLGQLEERPDDENELVPGFAGAKKIIGTDRLLEHLEESSLHRVDAVSLLKVRLFDIYLGDRDRHWDQWRWARFDDGLDHVWQPIPRDRDEAFVGNDGLIWSIVRLYRHNITGFGHKLESVRGVTEMGWDLDRIVLPELAKTTWDSLAVRIQEQLTDDVIEQAVRQLPPEYFEQGGDKLIRDLRRRRNLLPLLSDSYYYFLNREVEIDATDDDEDILITHRDDGSVEVTVSRMEIEGHGNNDPYFARRFYPDETHDVRLYLKGGDDRVQVRGSSQHAIKMHVIGGGGDDTLTDTTGTLGKQTRFYDYRGDNTVTISGTASIDTREYKRPPYTVSVVHRYAFDWGYMRHPVPVMDFNTDHGFVLGWGIARYRYGFRKNPYANVMTFRAGISGSRRFLFEYTAAFPDVIGNLWLNVEARASGVDPYRFHGFGNGTVKTRSINFYRVRQQSYTLLPSLSLSVSPNLDLSAGPAFKLIHNREDEGRFLAEVAPDTYGTGWFAQFGARAEVTFDTRDSKVAPRRGLLIDTGASVYPEIGDVRQAFGEFHGEAATYLALPGRLQPVLALRAGGKKVWGRFPFHEAAFVGGQNTVRGLSKQRFAGDASLYGNAEIRLRVSHFNFLFPTDWGLIGFADGGRVYLDDESSNNLHVSGGGGFWFAPMDRAYTFSLTLARSVEDTKIDFGVGFTF